MDGREVSERVVTLTSIAQSYSSEDDFLKARQSWDMSLE